MKSFKKLIIFVVFLLSIISCLFNRNAIENIGLVDEKGCALVKCKPLTDSLDPKDMVVLQNGDHLVDSDEEVGHQKCISNGNVYKSEEEVNHLSECSQNGVFDHKICKSSDSINSSVNNAYNESENVVMSEEIDSIEVISEEQVICDNNDEQIDSNLIKTKASVEQNHNTVCNEEMCESVVSDAVNGDKCDVRTNFENIENVCSRFDCSVDFEAENSSLSESSSLQSSASQTMPNSVCNSASAISTTSANTAMNSVSIMSAIASQNSQLNECTNISNSGINKKKFGKFRILNDESNSKSEDMTEGLTVNSEDSRHEDMKIEDKGLDSGSNFNDSQDNSEQSDNNSTPHKSNKQSKRRGRPAGSTKKERNSLQSTLQTMFDDEDLSRRRSSRLKTLEARKEQEKAVFVKTRDLDETSCDSTPLNTSDANDSQHSVNESNIRQKKKKSKKDKNKSKDKNKDKDNDSKKRKRKKKSTKSDENNQNCFSDDKTSEDHKNECFATPLPPSHYSNIKSNPFSVKSATDSDDNSPKPEKVKSRWRRNSELESGHGFCNDMHKHSAQNFIPKNTEPPPPFDMINENIYLFERFVL